MKTKFLNYLHTKKLPTFFCFFILVSLLSLIEWNPKCTFGLESCIEINKKQITLDDLFTLNDYCLLFTKNDIGKTVLQRSFKNNSFHLPDFEDKNFKEYLAYIYISDFFDMSVHKDVNKEYSVVKNVCQKVFKHID